MNTNDYQAQILGGIDLLGTLDEEFRAHPDRLEGFKAYVRNVDLQKDGEAYAMTVDLATKMARNLVGRYDPHSQIGRRCHLFSDQFNRAWRAMLKDQPLWFFLTIGEVKYRGKSVYDVTASKVADCVRRGFVPGASLGVHVWLTLEDMTIFDLTIMASLQRLRWVGQEDYARTPVVVGRPEHLTDFEYHPILVDNDFVGKVDRFPPRLQTA